MGSQSSEDLARARAGLAFDPEKLYVTLNEGYRDPEMRRSISQLVEANPVFGKETRPYLSRSERLENGLKMMKALFDLVDKHDLGYMEMLEALGAQDENLPLYLHEIAFRPVIESQGSDEQNGEWMMKILNHEILGCYLQTELGHGSNVQQLETTSTLDSATDEFVINSPTVSSTKWWIGGLGITATHGVVQAQLIIKGKRFGPHLFIVPLRSLEDHSLLPGVQAGEIGPKAHSGFAALDNGWARFDNVRVPRKNMLNRFASVSADGDYRKPPHDKLSYGGMIFIRSQMISSLAWSLAKASTIATRYLHVRRQFADPELRPGDKDFGVEKQVITYPSVYMRVLPQLAQAIVFITAGKDIANLYQDMSSKLSSGDTTLLAETHAVSSGLKTYISAACVDGTEILRRALGGHGFMDAAGVGKIYSSLLPSATYEGDNFILNLQVARAALKTIGAFQKDKGTPLSPSTAYFAALPFSGEPLVSSSKPADWSSRALQLQLVSLRAALHVLRLQRLLQAGKKFSQLSHECVGVMRAVVESFLVRRVIEAIDSEEGILCAGVEAPERQALRAVVDFYILHTIESSLPDLLEFGLVAPKPPSAGSTATLASPIEALRDAVDARAQALLPQSIGITDGFGFSDYDIDSALGRYDGRPYETLLERAQKYDEMNVGDAAAKKRIYEESIKPILTRGARLSKL